jgi:hypothetical protein
MAFDAVPPMIWAPPSAHVGKWDIGPQSLALLLHWAMPMLLRALPAMPPHDGIRLILPAFGFWSVFAGIGAQQVWDGMSRMEQWPRRAAVAALVAASTATAANGRRYYP